MNRYEVLVSQSCIVSSSGL